jgi:hypothetical protein
VERPSDSRLHPVLEEIGELVVTAHQPHVGVEKGERDGQRPVQARELGQLTFGLSRVGKHDDAPRRLRS